MKSLLKKFWNDEDGFVISLELVLVATIMVIGLVAGMAAVRDAVVNELADVAAAASVLDQSFTFGNVVGQDGASGQASGGATGFLDAPDDGDANGGGDTGNGLTIAVATAPATSTEGG